MSEIASWELLNQGSPEEFVASLCDDAMHHPATHHEYLQRLAEGQFPNMQAAVRDYCHQYYFYSAEFTNYLEAVIGGLELSRHRDVLLENLEEERGKSHVAGAEEIPHTQLFQRFRRAAGVTEDYEKAHRPSTTVLVWRDLFLQKCQSRQQGVGIGAIGIATEMIVSTIYPYILRAVEGYTDLSPDDYLFLRLHLDCDDEHAEELRQITVELSEDHEVREAIRFGVLSSLNLRNAFWDVMLSRATTCAATL